MFNIDEYLQKQYKTEYATISDVNNIIRKNEYTKLSEFCEEKHNSEIKKITDKICCDNGLRFVFISGPSGSGKSTLAKRTELLLKQKGCNAVSISLDDYFLPIENMPLESDGTPNFELFESIDYKLFNQNMKELMECKTIKMPIFDFENTCSLPNARTLKLCGHGVVIVEGLHALNRQLAQNVPEENKYRIYCTPITSLIKNDGTHISNSLTRLIRRTVRDFHFRNSNPNYTFELWEKAEKSAEENIYPYIENADFLFNSSLMHEFNVYKKHVDRIFDVCEISPIYRHFKDAIKSVTDECVSISDEIIPYTSIIKEFVGKDAITYKEIKSNVTEEMI